MTRILPIFLFLCILFSGCTTGPPIPTPHPSETWEPNFGLGLNTTATPPPGKFLEAGTDIKRLKEFLEAWAPRVAGECGDADQSGVQSLLRDQYYLSLIDGVLDQCQTMNFDAIAAMAGNDLRDGSVDAQLTDLKSRNLENLTDAIGLLSGVILPASALDWEVMARLMKRVIWLNEVYESSLELADAHDWGNDANALAGVYINIMVPELALPGLRRFVEEYPWHQVACGLDPLAVQRLQSDAWTNLNATIKLADELRPPSEPVDLSSNYGRLVRDFRPGLEFSHEHGWLPAILWYEYVTTGSRSYWNHRYDPVLPNQEEAMFLVSLFQNQSRNLITDTEFAVLQGNIPYHDWQADTFWALMVVASNPAENPWTYRELPCAANHLVDSHSS